jgi:hypothetical protein
MNVVRDKSISLVKHHGNRKANDQSLAACSTRHVLKSGSSNFPGNPDVFTREKSLFNSLLDIYSVCPTIANCLQRKQKRVLVHTQFSPKPAIRSFEQDICVACAHRAARIV